jgi:hypothetical protein
MVLNDYVLAIHVPGFAETFAECGCLARRPVERPTADKANHRHQWLLRTRLVLLSQKVAANGEQNHLFGKIHTSAMGGWNGSAKIE